MVQEVYPVPRFTPIVADFQRDFDELFDELLIGRWRTPAVESEPAMVLEHENAYEVRLCTGAFKPSELEVVVNEKNLTVTATRADNPWNRQLKFTDPVQTENVTAKWANRILTIVLPKKNQQPRTERK
jgi:HSP20 family molecular chaperone IbpA